MPDLVYVANVSAYTITELNVLKESESHYYTHNKKTDKYQSWHKDNVHLAKQGVIGEIQAFHDEKVANLEREIKNAQSKLQDFKEKYNV